MIWFRAYDVFAVLNPTSWSFTCFLKISLTFSSIPSSSASNISSDAVNLSNTSFYLPVQICRKSYCITPGVGGLGDSISKMLKFYVKFFCVIVRRCHVSYHVHEQVLLFVYPLSSLSLQHSCQQQSSLEDCLQL